MVYLFITEKKADNASDIFGSPMSPNSKKRIVICGNYGATNLGDEAILDGIISLVRRASPDADIAVMSANPEETAAMHGVESVDLFPAGVRSMARGLFGGGIGKTIDAIKKADLFILGGGGLFSDERPMAIVIWSLQARIARMFLSPGKGKIFCLGQSVGPLGTFFGRRVTTSVFNHTAAVTVRDDASLALLQNMGIMGVQSLADPAFALSVNEPPDEKPEPYVVITARPWIKIRTNHQSASAPNDVSKKIAQFIDWLWQEKGLKSVLIPFQLAVDNDVEVLNKIVAQVHNKDAVEIFEYSRDFRKTVELIERATAVVGMRLHSLIFSTMCARPFVALSYSKKVRDFAAQVGMEEFVMDWPAFDLQELCSRFDSLLNRQEELKNRLNEALLTQRDLALRNVDIIKNLLT